MPPLTIEPSGLVTQNAEFHDWLREHGIDPMTCYRVDLGEAEVTAHCHRQGPDGRFFRDGDGVAVEDPRTVALLRPLPADLRQALEAEEAARDAE